MVLSLEVCKRDYGHCRCGLFDTLGSITALPCWESVESVLTDPEMVVQVDFSGDEGQQIFARPGSLLHLVHYNVSYLLHNSSQLIMLPC